jgi:hypothetical protein
MLCPVLRCERMGRSFVLTLPRTVERWFPLVVCYRSGTTVQLLPISPSESSVFFDC